MGITYLYVYYRQSIFASRYLVRVLFFNMSRQKDINGKYIGDAIGYCHCARHLGAINRKIAREHKCIAKKCKYLEKYSEDAWKLKQKYKNQKRK